MRLLRLFLAALIALTVLVGGFIAAVLVVVTGLVGYVVLRVRRALGFSRASGTQAPNRQPIKMRTDDVIDI